MSSGTILVGARPDVAFVSEVEPQLSTADVMPVDLTLTDLGYSVVQMDSVGVNIAEFHFDVPSGQEASTESYFDLVVNHSAFLAHDSSGIDVVLNGQPIGAFGFSEETMALETRRFGIPPSAVRQGDNVLRIEAYLIPFSVCAPHNVNILWATIQPESTLHLPLSPAKTISLPFFDLRKYPEPFVPSPILLSDTAFVVAFDNPSGWNVASQIAFDLGYLGNQYLADLAVVFADAVPEDVRQTRHLLVVGRPSELPLITELDGAMPVPFEAGSDVAMPQNDLRVDFGLPSGTSVGYLELLPAPWNNTRAILTTLGSTDAGVQMAGTALISPTLRGQLNGNFAIVDDNQVVSSYMGHAARRVQITPSPVAAGTPQPTPVTVPPVEVKRFTWILPVLGISTLLIILLLVFLAISPWRRSSER